MASSNGSPPSAAYRASTKSCALPGSRSTRRDAAGAGSPMAAYTAVRSPLNQWLAALAAKRANCWYVGALPLAAANLSCS